MCIHYWLDLFTHLDDDGNFESGSYKHMYVTNDGACKILYVFAFTGVYVEVRSSDFKISEELQFTLQGNYVGE